MSWLYGQTWLWYLLAFLVGVLLAWVALVLPASRRLRAHRGGAPTGRDRRDPAGPPVVAPDPARPPAGADSPTEQLPAVNPAMSTLDTFGTATPARGTATAGLGAAGLDSTGSGAGTRDAAEGTPETPATSGESDAGPDRRA